jgi:AcrR family transcriptional regulator
MMKTRNGTTTKQQILDVAESHFAIYGFAGTSLRGIIKDAKVNIAAVAYHYGSKDELFNAVIERFAVPVVTEQLTKLDAVEHHRNTRLLLEAFFLPPLKHVKSRARAGETLGLFLGRLQTEPEPIFSLVDKQFAICRNRFVQAFRRCSPHATEADLQWNFEFMLSLVVCFLTRQSQIRKRYADSSDWTPDEAVARMVKFCESGMYGQTPPE